MLDSDAMAIQGLYPVTSDKVVEVGLDVGATGTFTFEAYTIENFDETQVIILEDRELGIFQDLKIDPLYTFTMSNGSEKDRFYLHFSGPISITTQEEDCEGDNGVIDIQQLGTTNSGYWDYTLSSPSGSIILQGTGLSGSVDVTGLPGGQYDLTLDNNNGIVVQKQIELIGVDQVEAQFLPDQMEVFVDQLIVFVNQSTGAVNYLWDFGDGSVSTDVQPIHTYSNAGNFDVSLIANNSDCQEEHVESIVVHELPSGLVELYDGRVVIYSYKHTLVLILDLPLKDDVMDLRLFNAMGQLIYGKNTLTNGRHEVAMTHYADGYYVVELSGRDQAIAQKVFVTK